MPELPEVETIVRLLRGGIGDSSTPIGKKILRTSVLWERSIAAPPVPEFVQRIQGQTVQKISRRGKYIVMRLSSDTLLFHLRMSGDLHVEFEKLHGEKEAIGKHDRVIFILQNGLRLIFEDARKFGRVWLLTDPQDELGDLGPEPLAEELSADQFHRMLKDCRRQLKPLLMDQSFLAGLGNIYTDEALFKAKLHPLTIASELNADQAAALLKAIRETLLEGIQCNGASIDWVYRGGDFQNHFFVYGRKGETCLICGTPIERIVVGQRGTHFCPNCQGHTANAKKLPT